MTSRNIHSWNHVDQWQEWWNLLWEAGFPVYPETLEPVTDTYMHLGNPTMIVQRSPKINSCFTLVEDLQEYYEGTWNYLGPQKERDIFFKQLGKEFWELQSNESLQKHEEFPAVLEQHWKLLSIGPDLDVDISLPSEFFGERSEALVFKLIERFSKWNYDQYFIQTDKAALQWQTTGLVRATGWIEKEVNGFKHTIILDETPDSTHIKP
jgi:hypothetical protein